MPEINVSCLLENVNPNDLFGSVATHGKDAAKVTWSASVEAAKTNALDLSEDDREGARKYFEGFCAWEADEIASWTDEELDALILQYASGDLSEAQSLCAGDGLADIDWTEYEALAEQGTIGGNLFENDGALFITLSS